VRTRPRRSAGPPEGARRRRPAPPARLVEMRRWNPDSGAREWPATGASTCRHYCNEREFVQGVSMVTGHWLSTVDIHVVSIPMRTGFRGIRVREAGLLHGPAGWGEFAPFLEYEPPEASVWLAAAREACLASWPAAVRTTVPVNATVPACDPEQASRLV